MKPKPTSLQLAHDQLADDLDVAERFALHAAAAAINQTDREFLWRHVAQPDTRWDAYIDGIIEAALAAAEPANWDGAIARVYCPLCSAASGPMYACNYTYPLGLERHLEGYGQRVRRCDVMEILHRRWLRLRQDAKLAAEREQGATNAT